MNKLACLITQVPRNASLHSTVTTTAYFASPVIYTCKMFMKSNTCFITNRNKLACFKTQC